MKKLILLISLVIFAGCGQTVVLMPDLDGSVGEVTVTAKSGETITLDQANQAVSGKDDVYVMSDEEVASTFAEVLEARPAPTETFILYFKSDSTELRPESQGVVSNIMESYRTRASTDVSVIGHSDAVGSREYNMSLSVRRANAIKDQLVDEGMLPEVIQTISHGEENPLIPTPDGVAQPKNRRVEVRVR